MTKFVFDPPHDHPTEIGWAPPILDLHGRPLVNGREVAPDHEKCARTFTVDKIFEVDKVTEPHLHQFCVADRRFREARRSDVKEENHGAS